MSRRTETAYKAKSPGKAAQDVKALDSGDMVKAAVVSRKITIPGSSPGQALIRGDLLHTHPGLEEAPCLVTFRVNGQKSAEAIVGDG